jgi:hypothetical protein
MFGKDLIPSAELGVKLCRPSETVLDILPASQQTK